MSTYEKITCKYCFKKTAFILKHLAKDKDCRLAYNETELNAFRMYSKNITDTNKKIRARNKYDSEKEAKKYKEKKYDKVRRAEKYLENKCKIAKQYRRDKKMFAEYYQRNKHKIRVNCKDQNSIAYNYDPKKVAFHSTNYELLDACFKIVVEIVVETFYETLLHDAKAIITSGYEKSITSFPKDVDKDKEITKKARAFYEEERYKSQLKTVISKAKKYAWNKMYMGKFDESFKKMCQLANDDSETCNNVTDAERKQIDKEKILKLSGHGNFYEKISNLTLLEIKNQYQLRLWSYRKELKKSVSDSNFRNKKAAKNKIKYQIQYLKKTNSLSEEMKNEFKRIKIGIEVAYQGIEIQLTETVEETKRIEKYFTLVKQMFENIKVDEVWEENDLFLDLLNIPCNCLVCRTNDHKRHWCARVVDQRWKEQRDDYTCPGCQKLIHKDVFKRHHSVCAINKNCKSW